LTVILLEFMQQTTDFIYLNVKRYLFSMIPWVCFKIWHFKQRA